MPFPTLPLTLHPIKTPKLHHSEMVTKVAFTPPRNGRGSQQKQQTIPFFVGTQNTLYMQSLNFTKDCKRYF